MNPVIRISERLFVAANKAAKEENRSLEKQIELWAQIGRYALANPHLPVSIIKEDVDKKG